jgi:tRNA1(Val) A37 N6-methylase TrmN6
MGLEHIVAAEIVELLATHRDADGAAATVWCSPYSVRGFVGVCLGEHAAAAAVDTAATALLSLRTALDVLRFHFVMALPTAAPGKPDGVPELLYQQLMALEGNPVPTMMGCSGFRVTTSRCGDHPFKSQQIEFEAGGALAERYGATPQMQPDDDADHLGGGGKGTAGAAAVGGGANAGSGGEGAEDGGGTPSSPAQTGSARWVNVRVDVVGERVLVATQINRAELSKRHKEGFVNRVTIKSNVAAAMLRLANIRPGDAILDPFCGSGTILLEAADMLDGRLEGRGSDSVARTATGAQANAEIEGRAHCLSYAHCSATALTPHYGSRARFDAVVTNPPWGIQTGVNTDLALLYRRFLSGSTKLLRPGGRLVVLVLKALQFLEIIRTYGQFTLLHTFVIKTRNNLPTVFVLERRQEDVERNTLRAQLLDLGQFVNFSMEIFGAIHNTDGGMARSSTSGGGANEWK